jgi:hypothetical protein
MKTPLLLALVVVLLLAAIAGFCIFFGKGALCGREKFASPRAHEVYNKSQDLFSRAPDGATYSVYKSVVPGADPVLYTDVRKLWTKGALSPETVQSAL